MSFRRSTHILLILALWLGLGPGSVPTFRQAEMGTSQQLQATTTGQGAILLAAKSSARESPLTKTWGSATTSAPTVGSLASFFSTRLASWRGTAAVCHSLQAQGVRWQI